MTPRPPRPCGVASGQLTKAFCEFGGSEAGQRPCLFRAARVLSSPSHLNANLDGQRGSLGPASKPHRSRTECVVPSQRLLEREDGGLQLVLGPGPHFQFLADRPSAGLGLRGVFRLGLLRLLGFPVKIGSAWLSPPVQAQPVEQSKQTAITKGGQSAPVVTLSVRGRFQANQRGTLST